MSEEQREHQRLIERILAEARREAEALRAEAQRSVDERTRALERRAREIDEAATERVSEERERLTAQTDAAIALLEQRARLELENRIYRTAEEKTREAMGEMRTETAGASTDGYRAVLTAWIVEAAIGLGTQEAIVSCPDADRSHVRSVLDDARAELERQGRSVALRLDEERSETGQGVVLRDAAGRRAFSNLVSDRLRRFRGELQRIVYHTVIEEDDGRTDHR
ncbi:MAG: V-type ATP synthase subunit E [Spirochaetota bacterium]